MASYTMELRTVIDYFGRTEVENWFKDYNINEFLTAEQIEVIENTGIWSKDRLARKIVDHYFMREIGFETPALFKHYAKTSMQEIMEEKLPLIYSSAIQYDPLINVDYTETFERTIDSENENSGTASLSQNTSSSGNSFSREDVTSSGTGTNAGTSSSTSSSSSDSLNIENRTPQTKITKQNLESGLYASNVTQGDNSSSVSDSTTTSNNQTSSTTTVDTVSQNQTASGQNTSSQTQSSSGSNNTDENYSKRVRGNSGVSATAQKMIEQYRDNIRAVDKEIIEELNSLFMGIY